MVATPKVLIVLSVAIAAAAATEATPKNTMMTLEFGRKSQKEDLFIDTKNCEYALDNPDNWRVDVAADKYTVSTMAKSESPGMLIVDCQKSEHFFSLVYDYKLGGRKNRGGAAQVERVAGIEFLGSVYGLHNPKPLVGLGSRVYDRSFDPLHLEVSHQNNFEGTYASRFEMGHRFGEAMTSYGVDQRIDAGAINSKKYMGNFARGSYEGLSLYLRRETELGKTEGSETLYLGTPHPIGLSYLSESSAEGAQIQRLSRGLGWSVGRVSFFNLLTLTSERSATISDKYLDWRSTVASVLFAGTSVYGKWQSRCPATAETLNCKIHDARLAARISYLDFGFEPIYGIFPHEVNLNFDWEPDVYQTYALSIRTGLGDGFLPEKFISEENSDKRWNALLSTSYLHPWRGVEYSMLTQLPFNNEWDPSQLAVALVADKDLVTANYSGGLFFKPLGQRILDSIQLQYASSLSENINSFAARIFDRSIKGVVVSNLSVSNISGVNVTCYSGGVALTTQITGDDGVFNCDIPPGALVAKVAARSGAFVSESTVEFEKTDRSQKTAIYLETEREVEVKFYLDVDRDGELGEKDSVLPLRNFVPVAEELIVNHSNNTTDAKTIIVESGKTYQLKVNEALLPFQFKVVNIFGNIVDTRKTLDREYEVVVLLQTK